ncbi:MAG: DUF58 domain-containing protein [Candidatus Dormibacteria bacterium]
MTWAPTPRLLAYPWLVAALLVTAIAAGRPELAAAAAPLTVFLLVGLATSRRPQPPGSRVCISPQRVVEGDTVTVTAEIALPTELEVLEVGLPLPSGFQLLGPANPTAVRRGDGSAQSVVFTVRPVRWGEFSLGDLYVRGRDDFGLRRFEMRLPGQMAVRVYPRSSRLRTLIRPTRTHVYSGSRVAVQKGEGIEFADVRPYVTGDLIRSVNWRASARRGGFWVNDRYPERNVDVVLLLDTFTHLGPPEAGTLEQMVRGAASLASAWLRDRDRVGLIGFGGILRWLEVGGGTRHAYQLVDTLLDTQVVFSYAWKGIDLIPVRLLPPHALIVGVTPLLDQRIVTALLDLRGRGFDLAVIELSPTPHVEEAGSGTAALARRVWDLDREVMRSRFLRAGAAVVPWSEGDALEPVVAEVELWRRRARFRGH